MTNTATPDDWITRAKDYAEFLDQDEPTLNTEAQAKNYLREELENIIAINGTGDLFESERELAKDLGLDLEEE